MELLWLLVASWMLLASATQAAPALPSAAKAKCGVGDLKLGATLDPSARRLAELLSSTSKSIVVAWRYKKLACAQACCDERRRMAASTQSQSGATRPNTVSCGGLRASRQSAVGRYVAAAEDVSAQLHAKRVAQWVAGSRLSGIRLRLHLWWWTALLRCRVLCEAWSRRH
uniref:Secreted protein n=1 Tax=Macrostomum lignano TaxID=282301 RepID=A0A1I8FCB7_9PLAT